MRFVSQRSLGWINKAALFSAGCCLWGCIKDGNLTELPDAGTGVQVNCAKAEEGLEFIEFTIADFEAPNKVRSSSANTYEQSNFMYSYGDGTAAVLAMADEQNMPQTAGYQPPAVTVPRCLNEDKNRALHIVGGPFLGWGGGVGMAMAHIHTDLPVATSPGVKGYCTGNYAGKPWCVPMPKAGSGDKEGDAINDHMLDLSDWDGVAVWAKRGPESQTLLRVLVGNKHTDDDLSFRMYQTDSNMPRYCERTRECGCNNHAACEFFPDAIPDGGPPPAEAKGKYYCGDPQSGSTGGLSSSSSDLRTTIACGSTRCNEEYPAFPGVTDNQFFGRPCTPHAMRTGVQSSYCFDPAKDPPPANADKQCGDYWTFPLHLTTEWKLYLVPFTSMHQQGFGKRWPHFDRRSVSVVRLTWEAGKIDYWIDNLRFYRAKRI